MKVSKKNWKSVLLSTGFGLFLIILNTLWVPTIQNEGWESILQALFSTVAAASFVNVLWEIIAKENFTQYLLGEVKISENLAQSGIDTVYVNFLDIQWEEEFKGNNSFTAAFIYAKTWRNDNDAILREFASKHKMRIIVPDPELPDVVKTLDDRFSFKQGETYTRITDCIDYYVNQLGHNIDVYLYRGTLQTSYYLFDNHAIMGFESHKEKKTIVPAIKAKKGGEIYTYIQQDINSLITDNRAQLVESIEIDDTGENRKVTIRRKEK